MELHTDVLTHVAKFGGPDVWKSMFLLDKTLNDAVHKFKNYYFGESISFEELKKTDGDVLRL